MRAGFRSIFPWHHHRVAHVELSQPHAWWEKITKAMHGALMAAGLSEMAAARVVAAAREPLVDPDSWDVFPDAAPALKRVHDAGWTNVVLSNHAPELPDIVEGVGLGEHIDEVVTSARAGYEKPHAEIFRGALEAMGHPKNVWMIGDNPMADVAGAEQVGIPAILVRVESYDEEYGRMIERYWGEDFFPGWRDHVHRITPDLHGAADIVLGD